jgi:dTDP-4-dehydrorhamnose reductase
MPRVLLFGSSGQVGSELAQRFARCDLVALDRGAADLRKSASLRDIIRRVHPEVILNAAAYTAVDRAESEPEFADLINHRAPAVMAEEAERLGCLLVHYSTDYVFDGSKNSPWLEIDPPAPLNVYGESKLAGERAIAQTCSRHLILRTSWIYGPHGRNFLQTMLRVGRERTEIRVVNDQWGAPTPAALLASCTRGMLEQVMHPDSRTAQSWAGIYNVSCGGSTSWFEFAEVIFREAAKRELRVRPIVQSIASHEYPTPARRPHNSVLSSDKLAERFHLRLPQWRSSLGGVFAAMALSPSGLLEGLQKGAGCS